MHKVKWLVQGPHLKSGDALSISPLLAVIHAYLPVGTVGDRSWKFRLFCPFSLGLRHHGHFRNTDGISTPHGVLKCCPQLRGKYDTIHCESLSSLWIWIQSTINPGNERSEHPSTNFRAILGYSHWHQHCHWGVSLLLESRYVPTGFRVAELFVFYCGTGNTTQDNSYTLSILFWGLSGLQPFRGYLGSNFSASISLPVKWGNKNTYLIRLLYRLNELIHIKELGQYSV